MKRPFDGYIAERSTQSDCIRFSSLIRKSDDLVTKKTPKASLMAASIRLFEANVNGFFNAQIFSELFLCIHFFGTTVLFHRIGSR